MRLNAWFKPCLALLLLVAAGCGQEAREASFARITADISEQSLPQPLSASTDEAWSDQTTSQDRSASAGMAGMMTTINVLQVAPIDRKIIYNAEIALKIDDLDKVEPAVLALVQQVGGYVADYQSTGSPGSLRSGTWKVRVPVDKFEGFLVDVAKLGELESNRRNSEDVTEQFYDVEARVKNKKIEEARLVELLEERPGKLEEILKVETELSRVRGEIEQFEGRLRLLSNLTSLTTVTIKVRERLQFQPEAPAAPNFTTRVRRTFEASLTQLLRFGENLVISLVALALWIPVIVVGLLLGFWFLKMLWRGLPFRRRRAIGP